MRPDSKRTSPVAQAEASKFLTETFGSEYASKSARHFKNQEDAELPTKQFVQQVSIELLNHLRTV